MPANSKLYIAAKPVVGEKYWHLYLVYDLDATNGRVDDQFVLRGGPEHEDGSLSQYNPLPGANRIRLEVGTPSELSFDAFEAPSGDTQEERNFTEVQLAVGQSVDSVWNNLVSFARGFGGAGQSQDGANRIYTDVNYFFLGYNSNATIATLLAGVGINVFDNIPLLGGTGAPVGNGSASFIPGLDSIYVAGAAAQTITISDPRIRRVEDFGNGATTIVVETFDQVSPDGTVPLILMADGSGASEDILLFKGINPSNVQLLRTLSGDLQIYLPNNTSIPAIELRGQFAPSGATTFNRLNIEYNGQTFSTDLTNPNNFALTSAEQQLLDIINGAPNPGNYSIGTSSGDFLTGSTGDGTLYGADGNDHLAGNGGIDAIYGGGGDDTIDVHGGASTLGGYYNGGAGYDTLLAVSNPNISSVRLYDIERLHANSVTLTADQLRSFAEVTSGNGAGNITINAASAGNFDLGRVVTTGTVTLNGSLGDDLLVGREASESIAGSDGDDQINGFGGGDNLSGGSGDDAIDGGAGADRVYGDAGNDTVVYDAADISIDGGDGYDTLILPYGTAYDLGNASNQVLGGNAVVTGFENVIVLGPAPQTMTGTASAESLSGGPGDDTIDGMGGADSLAGNDGDDNIVYDAADASIDGGAGSDTLVMNGGGTVNLASTTDQITNIENIDASASALAVNLTGDTGDNLLIGGSASDTILGGSGADVILGGAGNDVIDGEAGADIIDGGDGDDTITYDADDVLIDGGAGGNDTLVLASGIAFDLSNTADQVVGGGTAIGFEHVDVSGSTGPNVITGDDNANTLQGGSGDDTIDGRGGADTIYGNAGNDSINGGDGNDLVDGGEGDDLVSGGAGDDQLYGGAGADFVFAEGGNDRVEYRAEDVITDGGAGNDTLVVGDASVTAVNLANATDQVTGGGMTTGFENVDASSMASGLSITGDWSANTLIGGSGADIINGGSGGDTIYGRGGNDTLYAGDGVSQIYGEEGDDLIRVDINSAMQAGRVLDGGSGTDMLDANYDFLSFVGATVSNFEKLTVRSTALLSAQQLAQFAEISATTGAMTIMAAEAGTYDLTGKALIGNVTLSGSSEADALIGGAGNEVIRGNGGADTLNGGGGNDTITYDAADVSIDGGAGSDTLVLTGSAGLIVDLRYADQVAGGGNTANFENVDASAVTAGCTIIGGEGAAANNIIKGGSGVDIIYAHTGDDTVYYAANDQVVDGGTGVDTLVVASAAAMTVNLGSTYDHTSGDTAATSNFENVDASASTGAMTLIGSSAMNTLIGGSGADSLNGGAGSDTLNGGGGNDSITYDAADSLVDGGAGVDELRLDDTSGGSVINLSNAADQVSGGGVATGFENVNAQSVSVLGLNITGSSGANVLTGGGGADTINGNGGADVLDGKGGNDTLALSGGAAITASLVTGQVSGGTTAINFENIDAVLMTGSATIVGNANGNFLRGGNAIDFIYGGAGDDGLVGQVGADLLYCEDGNDSADYRTEDGVTDGGAGYDSLNIGDASVKAVDLSNTADQVTGGGITTAFEVVNAQWMTTRINIAGDAGANVLYGGSSSDIISSGGGADTIGGREGDDYIIYNPQVASMAGGDGYDTLVIASGYAGNINLGAADQVSGDTVNVTGFERVLYVTSGVTGTSAQDAIIGTTGNDVINGNGGADIIYAISGDDTVTYNASAILIHGGSGGVDRIVLAGATALTADLSSTNQVSGDAIVTGFEEVDAAGMTAAVTIIGDRGSNLFLRGGSGADTIRGGAGSDSLIGQGGADYLYGEDGDDYLDYRAEDAVTDGGAGIDELRLDDGSGATVIDLSNAADQVVGGGTTTNFENVNAQWRSGAAISITGSVAANTLRGGAAGDTLSGGLGNDSLYGGAGNDNYLFARGDGADTIFENDATAENNDLLSFASGVAHDQLWFSQIGNNLQISVIGSNDKVTVDNWYGGSARHVERVRAGGMELVDTSVAALVSAMAAMAPPPFGQTTLTAAQHQQLDPTLNASWHVAA